MLLDTRRHDPATRLSTEICVIGAGPAGLTVARELGGRGYGVCVLESGGLKPSPATQALLSGEIAGAPGPPLDEARTACLGGTTAIWSGWCRPLDPTDFEERPWVAHSGWPFDFQHLEPFYRRAQHACGAGSFEYEPEHWSRPGSAPLPLNGSLRNAVFHFSAPLHFGHAYRAQLAVSANITVLLYATALDLEVSHRADAVTAIRVRLASGREVRIHPRVTVVAGGGVENPRLLLLSNQTSPDGIGNRNGLVGRFFMEHPYVNSGRFLLSGSGPPLAFYRRHRVIDNKGPALISGVFTLDEATVRQEQLVNCVIFFRPGYREHQVFETAAVRAAEALSRTLRQGWMPPQGIRKIAQAARRTDRLALAAWLRLGIGSRSRLGLRAFVEPIPNPRNRVVLLEQRDECGRRRPRVEWMPGDLERRSLARAHELLDRAFRKAGLGRLELSPAKREDGWHPSLSGVCHHMGTTRMHRDPRQGVVDQDCRVHGVDNLFIAGSSVFPTAGYANPTLTIVALALRLADRIDGLLRAGAFPPA